jgi:hypothetical protein
MTEPYHSPDCPEPRAGLHLAAIIAGFVVLALAVALIALAVLL